MMKMITLEMSKKVHRIANPQHLQGGFGPRVIHIGLIQPPTPPDPLGDDRGL